MPTYGWFHVIEGPSSLAALHFHDGSVLKEVTHAPKCGVLDQEDLFAQGIYVSRFIKNAKDADALGSCTANATMAATSAILPEDEWLTFATASAYDDVVNIEEGAITFYHECTDQTGTLQQEWPPTDCGSSGPYIVSELQRLGLVKGASVAHGATSFVSLMQTTGILVGGPWFNSWETPGKLGMIDGNGTATDLRAAIASGVAGGHERYSFQIEHLALTATGDVTPEKTILVDRNSWSRSWGDTGNYRVHLSTYVMLGGSSDYRQLVA